ncbi:hypothetical protein QUF79_14525 [Fictibacillus enclensis]|uniref:hypothetical protein n=1 Tax=Fictibacillus enclensis TaxID=1017270 RepID=UPI0025A2EA3C|nr:hypothetical protein [Fictibacillus enclensis]MDM5199233.1 hypothetical protein [Fictibacillus enclensis]
MSDQNFIKGTVFFNGRDYNVREDEMEVFFTDMSDNKFKIDFSFSKDLEDNRKAGEALRPFINYIEEYYHDLLYRFDTEHHPKLLKYCIDLCHITFWGGSPNDLPNKKERENEILKIINEVGD